MIIGGLVLATTVGLGKVFALTKILGATLLRVGVLGILTRPFQALFTFIARNVLKFKNLLLGGILGIVAGNTVAGANSPNAAALREQQVVNNAGIATAASLPFMGALANLRRRTLNIGRALYNINKYAGNEVTSDVHFGDWGMPISQIIGYIDHKDLDINSIICGFIKFLLIDFLSL